MIPIIFVQDIETIDLYSVQMIFYYKIIWTLFFCLNLNKITIFVQNLPSTIRLKYI